MTSPRLLYSKQRHRFPPARHTSHPHLLRIQSWRLHLHRTRSSTAFLLFWDRQLQRLSNSIKIHFTFEPTISFQILKLHKKLSRPPPSKAACDSAIKSFFDESVQKELPAALGEMRNEGEELAVTALVTGIIDKLSDVIENVFQALDVRVHVGNYVLRVKGDGAPVAVVGPGREYAEAKYSDWIRCFQDDGNGKDVDVNENACPSEVQTAPVVWGPSREMADNPTSPAAGSHDSGGEQSPRSGVREQDRYLPIANISRIMKKALPANGKIAKDAKDTVQECVSEFISFVTSEASDKCQKEKRKTINGDDLLWAMATLGFEDYIEPLKVYLARYRELEGDAKGSARGGDGSSKRDAVGGLPGQNAQFALQGSIYESTSAGTAYDPSFHARQ